MAGWSRTTCSRGCARIAFPRQGDGGVGQTDHTLRRRQMQALGRQSKALPQGYYDALEFPLVAALFGRRARRFSMGATIPDGPLAYSSRHEPLPLSELERMMVLTAAAGNTGWHYMITRNAHYAPHLANYSAADRKSTRL